MHYYQKNIGDYRRDTGHLSLLEHGIYNQLIDTYYLDEKPIEKQKVIRWLSIKTKDEENALQNVLNDFFSGSECGNFWVHKRCDEEISAYKEKINKLKANGAKGGRPQKPIEKQKVSNEKQKDSKTKANQEPRTNNQEPITAADAAVAIQPHPLPIYRFRMTPAWQPDYDGLDLDLICKQAGITIDPFTPACLNEFRLYWTGRNDQCSQSQWVGKYLKALKRHQGFSQVEDLRHKRQVIQAQGNDKGSTGFIERITDTSWADDLQRAEGFT